MDCKQVLEQNLLERYLLDLLGETESEGLEHHLLTCPPCQIKLHTYWVVRQELGGRPRPRESFAATLHPKVAQVWVLVILLLSLTFIVFLAIDQSEFRRASNQPQTKTPQTAADSPAPQPPSEPETAALTQLAAITPPPYRPLRLRGGTTEADRLFQQAMESYLQGDYLKTIEGLRSVLAADPEAPHAHFFLGACYLLNGQAEPALDAFGNTLALGTSPYREEAYYYSAKALLLKGDVGGAIKYLELVVETKGNLTSQAIDLLHQLRSIGGTPD